MPIDFEMKSENNGPLTLVCGSMHGHSLSHVPIYGRGL